MPGTKVCPKCGHEYSFYTRCGPRLCEGCRAERRKQLKREGAKRYRERKEKGLAPLPQYVDSYLPSKPTTRRYEGVDSW